MRTELQRRGKLGALREDKNRKDRESKERMSQVWRSGSKGINATGKRVARGGSGG